MFHIRVSYVVFKKAVGIPSGRLIGSSAASERSADGKARSHD